MSIPEPVLDKLRKAGLLPFRPFRVTTQSTRDGIRVAKPQTTRGNALPDDYSMTLRRTTEGNLMELFRPTGLHELLLVLQGELAAWPPRLPEQPIFYPVLNLAYAVQIARDWNTKSDARVGYVTRFEIDDLYASHFQRRVVGGRQHEELWVPADELDELNRHILAPIRVVAAFFGADFQGILPTVGALRGKDAREQLHIFAARYASNLVGFHGEVTANRDLVFLHLPFWQQLDPSTLELAAPKDDVLAAMRRIWGDAFPTLPLPEVTNEHGLPQSGRIH